MDTETFKILGEKLAKNVIDCYGTKSVFQICRSAKICVNYEWWNPITLGEFDTKNNTICINLNAKIDHTRIIAHELGHYFIHQECIKLSRKEEEIVVNSFTVFFS